MANQPNKKREQILIALAVIGLLYGAVDFAIRTTGRNEVSSGDGALAAATFSLVTEELGVSSASQREANALEILNAVSAAWPVDIFVNIASFVSHQKEEGALALVTDTLVYSGYMTMGEKIFAVINGIEYRIGDMVEGFFLKEIDPMEIVMEKNGRPTRIPFRRIE